MRIKSYRKAVGVIILLITLAYSSILIASNHGMCIFPKPTPTTIMVPQQLMVAAAPVANTTIGVLPPLPNQDRWYEDQDMSFLLRTRVRDEQTEGNLPGAVITIAPAGTLNSAGEIDMSQLETLLREEQTNYGHLRAPRTVLVPLNIGNFHWVGLVIYFNENNQVTMARYIDSLCSYQASDSDTMFIRVQNTLTRVYGLQKLGEFKKIMMLIQKDGHSCGPLTIENLILAAQNPDNITESEVNAQVAAKIRETHSKLLQRNTAIQTSAISSSSSVASKKEIVKDRSNATERILPHQPSATASTITESLAPTVVATATTASSLSETFDLPKMLLDFKKNFNETIMPQDELYHELYTACSSKDIDIDTFHNKLSIFDFIRSIKECLRTVKAESESSLSVLALAKYSKLLSNLNFYCDNQSKRHLCCSSQKDLRTHMIDDFIRMATAFNEDKSDVFIIGRAVGDNVFDNMPTFLRNFPDNKTVSYYAIDPAPKADERMEKIKNKAIEYKITLRNFGDEKPLVDNGSRINCIIMPYHFIDNPGNNNGETARVEAIKFKIIHDIIKNKLDNGKTVLLIDLFARICMINYSEYALYKAFQERENFAFCTRYSDRSQDRERKFCLLLYNGVDLALNPGTWLISSLPSTRFLIHEFPSDKKDDSENFVACLLGNSLILLENKISKDVMNNLVQVTGVEKEKLALILQSIYSWDAEIFKIVMSQKAIDIYGYDKGIITFNVLSRLSPQYLKEFINDFEEMKKKANGDSDKLKQNILNWAIIKMDKEGMLNVNSIILFFSELELLYGYLIPSCDNNVEFLRGIFTAERDGSFTEEFRKKSPFFVTLLLIEEKDVSCRLVANLGRDNILFLEQSLSSAQKDKIDNERIGAVDSMVQAFREKNCTMPDREWIMQLFTCDIKKIKDFTYEAFEAERKKLEETKAKTTVDEQPKETESMKAQF